MHVARGLDRLPRSEEPVFVVVGVFDGLHLGHAYLLEHLVAEAARRSARPVVITFDHHPDEIITGSAPPLLTLGSKPRYLVSTSRFWPPSHTLTLRAACFHSS
mgnify:CR=1 FL=1